MPISFSFQRAAAAELVWVYVDIRGRDLRSTVQDMKKAVAEKVPDHTLRGLRWRGLLGAWLCLCLSLIGEVAQASAVTRQEAMPMAMSAMSPDSMAMDCTPCVRCYVAPAPVVQGGGDSKESQAPQWQIHATAQVEIARAFDSGVWHPRLPVRIEFSRWLN